MSLFSKTDFDLFQNLAHARKITAKAMTDIVAIRDDPQSTPVARCYYRGLGRKVEASIVKLDNALEHLK